MVQEEGRSINDRLDETLALLKQSKNGKKRKKKDFDLPFSVKFGAKAKLRKNHCLVQTIDDNGSIDFKMLPITNNMIHLQDKGSYHMANSNYMLRYKEYPMLIIPTFDAEPYNIKKNFEEADKEGRLTTWQKYYINVMNLSGMKQKMQISGKMMFLLGLGAVVVIAFVISKYG